MAKPFLLLLVALVAAVPSASCTPVIKVPERVNVEVPVPCVKEKPARPDDIYTAEQLLELPRGVRTVATWLNMLKLWMYAAELEAVVEGCSRIPQPAPAEMQTGETFHNSVHRYWFRRLRTDGNVKMPAPLS